MKTNILINYSVEFLSPFHFGTGLSSGTIDRIVRRDAKGYLIIPASTIKGILREKVVKLIKLYEKYDFLSEPIVRINSKEEHLNFFRRVSVADRIFGSPRREGTLFFDDLKMDETSKEFVSIKNDKNQLAPADYLQTHQRTRTRIMRATKTVASGALFKSEYGNSELKFFGRIYGQLEGIGMQLVDVPGICYEFVFLVSALKMMDRIGGNKSSGMGNVSLKIEELNIEGQKISPNQILSKEIWENIEAKMFEEDKEAFQNEN